MPRAHYLPALDHLRALAITLVFIYHYRLFPHPVWVDTIGSFGWTGVDLFFVLSGYLIAGQIFRELHEGAFSARIFLLKRFFRILPAYWVVLALYVLVPPFREWESLPPLWKLLSFTQNFGLDLRSQRTFSHAWSLCIEEQFYLLLPFALLLLHKTRVWQYAARLLILLCLAGIFARFGSWYHFVLPVVDTDALWVEWYKWIYYPTYNRFDGLLAGIGVTAIVEYSGKWRQLIAQHRTWLLLSGAILLAFAFVLCNEQISFGATVFGFPLIAAGYGSIVAAAASSRAHAGLRFSRITSPLAALSYSIYLTHKAAIHFAQAQALRFHLQADGTAMFFASITIAILCAALLHYSIERPFLRLRDRLLK